MVIVSLIVSVSISLRVEVAACVIPAAGAAFAFFGAAGVAFLTTVGAARTFLGAFFSEAASLKDALTLINTKAEQLVKERTEKLFEILNSHKTEFNL